MNEITPLIIIALVMVAGAASFLAGYFCALQFAKKCIENARLMGQREGRQWALKRKIEQRN